MKELRGILIIRDTLERRPTYTLSPTTLQPRALFAFRLGPSVFALIAIGTCRKTLPRSGPSPNRMERKKRRQKVRRLRATTRAERGQVFRRKFHAWIADNGHKLGESQNFPSIVEPTSRAWRAYTWVPILPNWRGRGFGWLGFRPASTF